MTTNQNYTTGGDLLPAFIESATTIRANNGGKCTKNILIGMLFRF